MPLNSPDTNIIRVTGSGSVAQDNSDLQSAATVLSGTNGTLAIGGSVSWSQFLTLTGGINLVGEDSTAKLTSEITAEGNHIEWNPTVTHNRIEAGNHGTVFAASAIKGDDVITAVGHTFTKGQWVLIWSEDQIPNQRGHTAFAVGVGDHPAEMHLIAETEPTSSRSTGFWGITMKRQLSPRWQ